MMPSPPLLFTLVCGISPYSSLDKSFLILAVAMMAFTAPRNFLQRMRRDRKGGAGGGQYGAGWMLRWNR
jgi:hypothetical protein